MADPTPDAAGGEPPPLRRFDYRLDRRDALAYEALPRELTGLAKLAFFLFLGSAGIWYAMLEEAWDLGDRVGLRLAAIAGLVAIHWALATLAMTLATRRRAARRIPVPVAAGLEDHGDHLLFRVGDPAEIRPIAFETIRQVVVTAERVMVDAPPTVAIVPLAAFEDAADMTATAADWDRRSCEAVP